MIEWTESAKRTLDAFCARSKAVLAGTGADADEVSDDLRRHVEEEVLAARLSVVTEEDVRRILARVGDPGPATGGQTCAAETPAPASASVRPEKIRPGFWILFFTVILPTITIGFELVTAMSSAVLFDPFPTWANVVMAILVPAVNFRIWRAARARDPRYAKVLGWLNGAACGVCLFYAILYVPFIPFAGLALIFFGAGLIALAPLFACITTPWLRSIYQKRLADIRLPGGLLGGAAAMAILVALQLPTALTYYGLARAASDDPGTRSHGVKVLRNFGNADLILRAAYGFLRREPELDLVRWIATGGENIGSEQARVTYYRVTGNPFNAVPPPMFYTRAGRWSLLEEDFTWDDARGGDVVAGQMKGLSLMSSRMDALAEPDAAIVYCEWTLEFKNVSARQREARAQVALPPGGVVSRVTLWINGEEREAAFGGRSQVREAYQEVAVAQQRDPILVTTCGPDRVMVQCFPVPRNGGVMKVKLGVTTPLLMDSAERGRFIWPRFLERNFAIGADLKHSLWIESSGALANEKGEAAKPANGGKSFALLQTTSDTEFNEKIAAVTVQRTAEIREVWTPAEESGQQIRQTLRTASAKPVKRLIVVLDGSNGLQPVAGEVAEALSHVAGDIEMSVLVAADSVVNLTGISPKPGAQGLKEFRERLPGVSFRGGQDNLPALEVAWDLASAVEDGRGAVDSWSRTGVAFRREWLAPEAGAEFDGHATDRTSNSNGARPDN